MPRLQQRSVTGKNVWSISAFSVGLVALFVAMYAVLMVKIDQKAAEKKIEEAEKRSDANFISLRDDVTQLNLDGIVNSMEKTAFLTTGETGYSNVRFDLGTLTVALENVTDFANGSKVVLRFGNPLSSDIEGLNLTIDYGEVGFDRKPIFETSKTKKVKFSDTLKPGSWTFVDTVLDGLPSSKLGYVRIREVSHTGIGFSQSR